MKIITQEWEIFLTKNSESLILCLCLFLLMRVNVELTIHVIYRLTSIFQPSHTPKEQTTVIEINEICLQLSIHINLN